jgi:hypothetical protein
MNEDDTNFVRVPDGIVPSSGYSFDTNAQNNFTSTDRRGFRSRYGSNHSSLLASSSVTDASNDPYNQSVSFGEHINSKSLSLPTRSNTLTFSSSAGSFRLNPRRSTTKLLASLQSSTIHPINLPFVPSSTKEDPIRRTNESNHSSTDLPTTRWNDSTCPNSPFGIRGDKRPLRHIELRMDRTKQDNVCTTMSDSYSNNFHLTLECNTGNNDENDDCSYHTLNSSCSEHRSHSNCRLSLHSPISRFDQPNVMKNADIDCYMYKSPVGNTNCDIVNDLAAMTLEQPSFRNQLNKENCYNNTDVASSFLYQKQSWKSTHEEQDLGSRQQLYPSTENETNENIFYCHSPPTNLHLSPSIQWPRQSNDGSKSSSITSPENRRHNLSCFSREFGCYPVSRFSGLIVIQLD